MADIAARAGVHQTTVSLALRDSPRLTATTRKRIQTLAREMGYRKDPYVTALMAQVHTARRREESPVLAVLDSLGGELLATESTFRELLKGFRARAESLGYAAEVIPCGGQTDAIRNIARHLQGRGIRAAFLPGSTGALRLAETLTEAAMVSITGGDLCRRLHTTGPDHFHNARVATAELLARGRSRFALLIPEGWRAPPLYDWIGGIRAELQKAIDDGRLARLVEPRVLRVPEGDARTLDRLLGSGKTAPDALLGYPVRFLDLLGKTGRTVPDDIAFASPALFPEETGMPGIHPRRFEVGQAAADILAAQLHRHEFGLPALPRTVLLEGVWVEG